MTEKKRVLFVCLGNICRSPAGEGVFNALAQREGVADQLVIDSAGTSGWHAGAPADQRMQAAAQRRGYTLTSRSRQATRRDLETFDLIIAMDRDNLRDLRSLDSDGRHRAKIRLLSDFIPNGRVKDVPDPYYGDGDGFEQVLDMIEAASPNILAHLLDERVLEDA